MRVKLDVFSKLYDRYTDTDNKIKKITYSRRINQSPIFMVFFSRMLALFLCRLAFIDHLISLTPGMNLLVRFLYGNANLILKSPEDIKVETSNEDEVDLEVIFDVVVVGSGPGGSVAALRSAELGKKVLVVESGKLFLPTSIEHHSLAQTIHQFKNGGINFIWGIKPIMFAEGMTVGGGSEVNSGLYHRLEGAYRSEILQALRTSEVEWAELEAMVENELSVQISPGGNKPDYGLVLGAEINGLESREIPRWRKYGDVEQHQGMQVTYLNKARRLGTQVLVGSEVQRLIPKQEYVEVNYSNLYGKHVVRGKEVILAAGTIETPRIINRSKITKIDYCLNLHPMLRAVAAQDKVINNGDLFPSWQAWTNDLKFKFGYSVSTFPYLSATLLSLGENRAFQEKKLAHLAAYFSSFVLEDSVLKLKRLGSRLIPIIKWGKMDKKFITIASNQLRELLQDGEAIEIWPKKGSSPVTTVHLFGSIPINASTVIDSLGRLRKDPRIRISDGSLMPYAPWGNPQGPIMVLCELMAKRSKNQ